MNQRMRLKIGELGEKHATRLDESKVSRVLFPDFVSADGCVLLHLFELPNLDNNRFISNEQIPDRTQLEAFVNHIHLSDIFEECADFPEDSLRFGLEIVEAWAGRLKVLFPQDHFHLVLSYDEFGSVVRFYKLRDDEEPWMDVERLDGYSDEGILVRII